MFSYRRLYESKQKGSEYDDYPPEWGYFIARRLEALRVPKDMHSLIIQRIWDGYSDAGRQNVVSRIMRMKGKWSGKGKRSRSPLQEFVEKDKHNGSG